MTNSRKAAGLDKFFGITAAGSTMRMEIMAGVTTFFAMVYILMVNAGMFTDAGVSYGAIYIATAISAVVGTVCIGLLANLPLAQASGMGLNAFFVYTCVLGFGMSYANALVLVLFDGVLFIILTVTGLRRTIFQAIPQSVRVAIPAVIGLFIAFIGLQNAGIVAKDAATGVTLASFNLLKEGAWPGVMPMLVTIAAVLAIILSFSPKFEAVINTIPTGIIGGISFVLYGMISAIGVRNVVENRVDFTNTRNVVIAALILVLSLGIANSSAGAVQIGSVSLSGLAVASIVGIILNAVLPGKDYEFQQESEGSTSVNFKV